MTWVFGTIKERTQYSLHWQNEDRFARFFSLVIKIRKITKKSKIVSEFPF
jgi:hypothetical protein